MRLGLLTLLSLLLASCQTSSPETTTKTGKEENPCFCLHHETVEECNRRCEEQASETVSPTGPCSADGTPDGPRFPSSCRCPEGYVYGGINSGKCIRQPR